MTKFTIDTGLGVFLKDDTIWDYNNIPDRITDEENYKSFVIGGECKDYLHFAGLEIFDRNEDRKIGQRVRIFGGEILVTDDVSGNPSPRRDAVSLYFNSENGCPIRMNIIQHKGETIVQYKVWDGKKPTI